MMIKSRAARHAAVDVVFDISHYFLVTFLYIFTQHARLGILDMDPPLLARPAETLSRQRGVLTLGSVPGDLCVSRFLIWSAPKPIINTASNAGKTSNLRSCSFAPAINPNRA